MSRPARKGTKVRLSLKMAPSAKERLERLLELTDSDSYADVVRRALALYEVAVASNNDGGELIVRRGDGVEQKILLDY